MRDKIKTRITKPRLMKSVRQPRYKDKIVSGIRKYGEIADALADAYYGKPKKKKGYWSSGWEDMPSAF